MSEARTIKPKGVPDLPEYLDFVELRGEGIRHIQDLSGALWTDHNVHDPGITILEALCYALTDLDYRSKLDIRELLARPPQLDAARDDNFFTAAEILSNNPLSILDYRKLLIDIPGVRNAWLKPAEKGEVDIWIDQQRSLLSFDEISADLLKINGLYKVYLELEPSALTETDACGNPIDRTGDILAEVQRQLHAHRNLCEDFLDIIVLREERISLCADIEIKPDAFPDEVMLSIMEAAREFLSPTLPFYSLRQMLEKGKTPDEIFEGRPLLNQSHGFIDPEDLKKLDLRQEIHVSDMYRILLDLPGVAAIKKLTLYNYTKDSNKGEDWILPLRPQAFRPSLAIDESLRGITFFKRGVPFAANATSVKTTLEKHLINPDKVLKKKEELDLEVPKGQYRPDLGEYHSIQHDFPVVYGIGADGLPENVLQKRQAQALQLKGYLLFYDQLLANYLAQLSNLRAAFSTHLDENNGAAALVGSLNSVPKLNLLIRNTGEVPDEDGFYLNETIATLNEPGAFRTPQDRDFALEQIVSAFDNGAEKIDVEPTADQSGFYFIINVEFGRTIKLRSTKTYATTTEAFAAIERVRFLATLLESYEKTDKPQSKKYSFSLVYKPVNYTAYLQHITENPEQFYARKNRFFDHLLRRFAEDFTDYTLLTFALSRKQGRVTDTAEFSRRFARDKAAFLADYPNISRNRGQAFNYTSNPRHGENISGLERRVARLLGIAPRASKRLNYFDAAPFPTDRGQYYFEYRDIEPVFTINKVAFGNLLFRSRLGYDSKQEADAAKEEFIKSAKNPDRYIAEICPLECAHTFRVLDACGCEIAYHPFTYGSAELRDEIMHYAQGVVQGQGFYHTLASETEGWVFRLKDGDTILLESAQAAHDELSAKRAFHRAMEAARTEKNYCKVNEPVSRGYSFEITSMGEVVAQHPAFYGTVAERDKALSSVFGFIKKRKTDTAVHQLPTRHRWQLLDENGALLMEAIHFFKKTKQTAFAFYHAMTQATRIDNFRKSQNESGYFTFELLQRRLYQEEMPDGSIKEHELLTPIGISATAFPTENACEAAIKKIISLAEGFSQVSTSGWDTDEHSADFIWSELRLEHAQGVCKSQAGAFYAELPNPDDTSAIWLSGTRRAATAEDALVAFYDVLNAACAGSFRDTTGADGCPFGFEVTDENENILAEHPAWYTCNSDRVKAQKAISEWVCAHRLDFEVTKVETAYRFEFRRRRCNDQMEIVLNGLEKFKEKADADAAFVKVLNDLHEIAKNNPFGNVRFGYTPKVGPPPFRFWIKNEQGDPVAEHPKEYETFEDLERATSKFFGFFTDSASLKDRQFSVPDIEIPLCTNSDGSKLDGYAYTWRVTDDEERLARFALHFPNKEAAQQHAHQLARQYLCQLPRFTSVWTERDNFTGKEPVVFFTLRDLQHCYWRSALEYPSVAEAQKAFAEQYVDIMTRARLPEAYSACLQKDGKWAIQLHDSKGAIVAESCNRFERKEQVIAETDRLLDHARFFPIIRYGKGFSFRLFNAVHGDVLWQSLQEFDSPGAAMKGLQRFLDLLLYEGNYQPMHDGCHWRIEIIEILLESKPFFTANVGAGNADENTAWRRIDQFLDNYAQLDEAIFYDYTDHHHCCGYGFRIVNECYRLALYTTSFHQPCDRETALDCLVQDAICDLANPAASNGMLDWLLMSNHPENDIDTALRLAIAKAMRYAGSYVVFTEKAGQQTWYRLGLVDVDSSPLLGFGNNPINIPADTAFLKRYDTEAAVIKVMYDYIIAANQIPVTLESPGQYRFEHRIKQNKDEIQAVNGLMTDDCAVRMEPMPVFKTKWVSVNTFGSVILAWDMYKQFVKLLSNKNAYARTQAADGSPTLMIVDPEQVVATHPRTYTTRAQRDAAKQNLIGKLNIEGLHMLEHVLLRPRHHEKPGLRNSQGEDPDLQSILLKILIGSKKTGASGDTDFEDYIPGADPYSFRTTIILPYWPRRFRDNDFRTFFENTLRRESPAQVLPSIVWIRPQQMKEFEKRFLCWLERVGKDACARPMIKAFEELENVFVDAFALDCEAGGGNDNIIILDVTPIN